MLPKSLRLIPLLLTTAALAQSQPPAPPVEQTEAPENEATSTGPDAATQADVAAKPRPAPSAQVRATGAPPVAAPKPPKWDVNAPPGVPIAQVPIDVDEGSWIDLDVSPDGRTVAFSLLGDIYTMPIAGGAPTRIADGLAWEVQPRFSPDGRRIAFTSDRGGGDNIWIMNADGSDKRQLTREDFRLLNQPSWSKDGRYIVAKKHFTTGRSLGTGEVWMYHVGGGAGVQLVKRANERLQKELGEPVFAADGRGVFYTRNISPGPIFEYAQDTTKPVFAIERYDLDTGETAIVAGGFGGAVRPTPSPDGRLLAFVRRERDRSRLYVRELASGAERRVYDDLDRDVAQTWAVSGVYPNMAWTPDGRALVFWAGGKIRRVGADGQGTAIIPFRVRDTRGVTPAPHPEVPVAPDRFQTRMVRFAEVSPDGRTAVFESLGKLWLKPTSGGVPRRLTRGPEDERELWPSWSRDGRSIVYVGWTDLGLGRIKTVAAGGGAGRAVMATPGHYAVPRFSPDGRTIVFERRGSEGMTSPRYTTDPGVYRVAAAGGGAVRVAKDVGAPQYGAANDRLFMVGREEGGKATLVSTDLNGEAKRVHAKGELANDFAVSPDGRMLAFRQNYEAFVTPLMPGAQAVEVAPDMKALPVRRLSANAAKFIRWSGPDRLHWLTGPTLSTVAPAALMPGEPQPADAGKPPLPTVATVSLAREVTAAKPAGVVALVGARVLTMARADGGAIDDAVVLIRGDRIAAVGPGGSTPVPPGARVVDLGGKTIIPGLVDAHAHGPQGEDELVPQQNWSLNLNLAYGTTTIHDPSARASEIFAAAEMQRAGLLLGPRIFSTAEIVYGAKAPSVYAQIDGLDDALAHVRRIKAEGGHSIKNYNQPRRDQRQQVVEAARRENMQVVAEGGSLYGLDMTIVADGNSTLEHNIPLQRFYNDVLQFMGAARTNYTPTLVVTYGGLAADPYWRMTMDVFDDPLTKRHAPPAQLAADNVRRVKAPESEFVDAESAREAKKLSERGVLVSIGAHGQQAGLGPHWEMWSFVRGGMTPVEALAAGTITAARSLGMAKDIGSLEPGKLADLVVLDADPSADIRNTQKVSGVMLGGRLYDPATLNETATGAAKRQPYWWEADGGGFGGVGSVAHADGDAG